MGTIVTSEFSRTGVLPGGDRNQQVDDREPRGSHRAIGVDLMSDETIQFQRLVDGEYPTEQCYLPWCAEDIRAIDMYSDTAHDHTGAVKRIETGVLSTVPGGGLIETDVLRLTIEQADNDEDSEYTTGEAHVYLAIGEAGETTSYVLLTAEKLLELGNTSIALAQVIFASRGLVNPNRVTPEELQIAAQRFELRMAVRAAKDTAEKAEKDAKSEAEFRARQAAAKVRWYDKGAYQAGRAFGSRLYGRFPKFVDLIHRTHELRIVHFFRLGIDMATINERLQKTPKGREIAARAERTVADYNAKHKS